jgi:hypothetical protein
MFMRRRIFITSAISSSIASFLSVFKAQAQTPPQTAAAKPVIDPAKVAESWVDHLNALDDWFLTVDGKESGLEELVNKMMEFYAPDVIAEVPPHDPDQIGPVMLRGREYVRKYFEAIATTHVRMLYIHKRQTTKEVEGERLIYTTPLPWGGVGIAFQIIAAYSLRQDRRKFTAPGAVFLQLNPEGKINRLRLFEAEVSEVVAL